MESRFKFSSFFFSPKLSYLISFNPEATIRQAPPEGLRAIAAHELAHADYYHSCHRIKLLSLVRLLSAEYTVRFERRADLEAIDIGYGPGLQSFRTWLYQNIPSNRVPQKKRNYFSPEEIAAIMRAKQVNSQIIKIYLACVPLSLQDIEREALNPPQSCRK